MSTLRRHDLFDLDPSVQAEPYVPPSDPRTPWAVLVDVDGTLALLNGRSPYDESTVLGDLPNDK